MKQVGSLLHQCPLISLETNFQTITLFLSLDYLNNIKITEYLFIGQLTSSINAMFMHKHQI